VVFLPVRDAVAGLGRVATGGAVSLLAVGLALAAGLARADHGRR
jgi:hypothetical protein